MSEELARFGNTGTEFGTLPNCFPFLCSLLPVIGPGPKSLETRRQQEAARRPLASSRSYGRHDRLPRLQVSVLSKTHSNAPRLIECQHTGDVSLVAVSRERKCRRRLTVSVSTLKPAGICSTCRGSGKRRYVMGAYSLSFRGHSWRETA